MIENAGVDGSAAQAYAERPMFSTKAHHPVSWENLHGENLTVFCTDRERSMREPTAPQEKLQDRCNRLVREGRIVLPKPEPWTPITEAEREALHQWLLSRATPEGRMELAEYRQREKRAKELLAVWPPWPMTAMLEQFPGLHQLRDLAQAAQTEQARNL